MYSTVSAAKRSFDVFQENNSLEFPREKKSWMKKLDFDADELTDKKWLDSKLMSDVCDVDMKENIDPIPLFGNDQEQFLDDSDFFPIEEQEEDWDYLMDDLDKFFENLEDYVLLESELLDLETIQINF